MGEQPEKLAKVKAQIRSGEIPDWAEKWRGYRGYTGCDTVGAVAIDRDGGFAASNSSGGTSFQMPGRVGDSPIIGAGLYVGTEGAVATTGIGEDIIRTMLALETYKKIKLTRNQT